MCPGFLLQMERSVSAAEAKKAAQQQSARGLDAMLLAIGGAKKVRRSSGSRPRPPVSISCASAATLNSVQMANECPEP